MSSKIAQIADDVKAALNTAAAAHAFAEDFVAKRVYVPASKLEDLATLSVKIVPKTHEREPLARSRTLVQRDVAIDIGIQKRLAPGADVESEEANATADALLFIAEQIADFFGPGDVLPSSQAAWIKSAHDPIFDTEHLRQMRTFTTVVTVTFRRIA